MQFVFLDYKQNTPFRLRTLFFPHHCLVAVKLVNNTSNWIEFGNPTISELRRQIRRAYPSAFPQPFSSLNWSRLIFQILLETLEIEDRHPLYLQNCRKNFETDAGGAVLNVSLKTHRGFIEQISPKARTEITSNASAAIPVADRPPSHFSQTIFFFFPKNQTPTNPRKAKP
jgi:hypothetical protein